MAGLLERMTGFAASWVFADTAVCGALVGNTGNAASLSNCDDGEPLASSPSGADTNDASSVVAVGAVVWIDDATVVV